MKVRNFLNKPIITSSMDARLGLNINGPSPLAAPEWIENPLGGTIFISPTTVGFTSVLPMRMR